MSKNQGLVSVPLKPGRAHGTKAKTGKGNRGLTNEVISDESQAAEQSLRNQILAVTSRGNLEQVRKLATSVNKEAGLMETMGRIVDACMANDEVLKAHIEAYQRLYKVTPVERQNVPGPYRDKNGEFKATPKRVLALTYWPSDMAEFSGMHVRVGDHATRAEQRIQMWRQAISKRFATINAEGYQPKAVDPNKRRPVTAKKLVETLAPENANSTIVKETEDGLLTSIKADKKYSAVEVKAILRKFAAGVQNRLRDFVEEATKAGTPITRGTAASVAGEQADQLMQDLKNSVTGKKAKGRAA